MTSFYSDITGTDYTAATEAAAFAAVSLLVGNVVCHVTGQGMAIYKSGIGWVKASDDTTAIT